MIQHDEDCTRAMWLRAERDFAREALTAARKLLAEATHYLDARHGGGLRASILAFLDRMKAADNER